MSASIVYFRRIILLCFFILGQFLTLTAQSVEVRNLAVDHLVHTDLQVANGYVSAGSRSSIGEKPLIANKQPVLGWELHGMKQGAVQSAYRILVSDQPDKVDSGNIWDSGKVASKESSNVQYTGKALRPLATYYWSVMVWDTEDVPSAWSAPQTFSTAGQLEEYRTSFYPLLKTNEQPQHLVATGDVNRIDFGKAAFGQLRFTLDVAESGTVVTVRLGEGVNPDGTINRKPAARSIRYAEYEIPLKRGHHTYQVQFRPDKQNTGPRAIHMPDYIGEVLPFRYVEIEGYTGKIEKSAITRATVHYPFDDFAAHFESSDTILNAVWELCKYSIKATSFAGIYVDGDRERIPYEADAYINQLCHYSVDKEFSMARRSHEYLLHNATWPTEWILQSVLMAYNDYLHTGDIRSVNHYYKDLKAKLLLPLRENNGLLSTKNGRQTPELMQSIHYNPKDTIRDIVDWPHTGGFGMLGNGETDGFVFTPYNTVVNAFHYKALMDMSKMAAVLGKTDDATLFLEKAKKTYDAFQSLLWDRRQKAYRDGAATDHASLHANMMALAFGLVPEKHINDVMKFIRSRGMACSVYGSQFLMDAVYDAGDADYALSLLTSQADRSWYNMIRSGSTITMEAWDNKFKPNQDWNHAWGAVPANIIPRKLMGIEPVEPGWKVFRVKPQLGSLEWANIKTPTIKGTIEVSCRQTPEDYRMEINVPANTSAIVELPKKGNKRPKFTINGKSVKATEKTNGSYTLPTLSGGRYAVELFF
ncbi:family 78 glycoside hydrolase catalytic domain [Parapedobacter sp. SGR-10]|uniref:family 78 glycoside hydrolase catalytic domain n=1 Tax=Parapedobacter sp. SGR-10 TaxID=2710879 RepID=UPI0013D66244|nr:family 78 glycoside hydrolase catalytic domain [Parapedobacter sp. SGR-10]NGF57700.1 family 78 glycoside hydrolase catalytic domain [Parapedobacter sp. SGR-10]